MNKSRFFLVIPTYDRVPLLETLLVDISKQDLWPERIIIVDGNPNTGAVLLLIREISQKFRLPLTYIPSNFANLSYQRFLGWKYTSRIASDYLLYLDDDLRLLQQDIISKLITNLDVDKNIVGVTSSIRMGKMQSEDEKFNSLYNDRILPKSKLVNLFGSARNVTNGDITPTGNRIMPIITEDMPRVRIKWLRGGVMLFRMSAIDQSCFSEDLFALDHIRCGKGEDTFLSRQVSRKGGLLFDSTVVVDHPNLHLPKTYPVDSFSFGYASAYSRRFLNDHYRINAPTTFSDRLVLLNTYLGNNLLNMVRVFSKPTQQRIAFTRGYLLGSFHGLTRKPTAKNLTPTIDWWDNADKALAQVIEML